jgi:hypothetical protein
MIKLPALFHPGLICKAFETAFMPSEAGLDLFFLRFPLDFIWERGVYGVYVVRWLGFVHAKHKVKCV